jgi:chemotaxis signal transduction protein
VSDIISVSRSEIAPIPDVDGDSKNPYFTGLVKDQDKLLALLSLEHLAGHRLTAQMENAV